MRGLSVVLSVWLMAIFVFVSFLGWHLFRDMSMIYARVVEVEQANRRSHRLHEEEVQVRQMISYVHNFLITGSGRYIQRYNATAKMLTKALLGAQNMDVDSREISSALQPMHLVANKIFTLPFATGNMEGPILMQELDALLGQLSHNLSMRHHSMDSAINRSMHMVSAMHLDMRDDFLLALFILLLLLMAVSIYLYRRVVYPLTLLRTKVAHIGDGNFTPNCPDFGDNEIGELSQALNRMGDALIQRNSELVQARSVAAHQEKMHALGLMTASIAHEVGNPLSAVAVSLDVCREKLLRGDGKAARRYLEAAGDELRRTENIIRNVLDFGRQSSDEHASINMASVVESALYLVQLSHSAKGLVFNLLLPDGLPMVRGSEDMIRQVLVNLLLNAADVSQKEQTVVIRADYQGDMVVVDVEDQGGGVSQVMCDQIFSPLFTTKSKGKGTGLGLAISRDLMRRMDGELMLVENSEKGCVFRMLLPIIQGEHDVTATG
ncbi:MAG: HAMP domain-containing sensor histidine kinase [Mariprofundales bacterium]